MNEGKLSGGPKERKGRYSEPENGSATSPSSLPCTKSASLPELSRFTNSPDNSQSAESASTLDSSRGPVVAEAVGGIPSPVIAGFENLEITSTGDSNRLISTNPGAADPPHLAHGPSARTPAAAFVSASIDPAVTETTYSADPSRLSLASSAATTDETSFDGSHVRRYSSQNRPPTYSHRTNSALTIHSSRTESPYGPQPQQSRAVYHQQPIYSQDNYSYPPQPSPSLYYYPNSTFEYPYQLPQYHQPRYYDPTQSYQPPPIDHSYSYSSPHAQFPSYDNSNFVGNQMQQYPAQLRSQPHGYARTEQGTQTYGQDGELSGQQPNSQYQDLYAGSSMSSPNGMTGQYSAQQSYYGRDGGLMMSNGSFDFQQNRQPSNSSYSPQGPAYSTLPSRPPPQSFQSTPQPPRHPNDRANQDTSDPNSTMSDRATTRQQQQERKRLSTLPKPPTHSPFAMWCGNVPSDCTEGEIFTYFTTRSSPSSDPDITTDTDVDLNIPGVESIHLISRSNCCFVNYRSDIHLQHAIATTNGASLRPDDWRLRPLVCRVRKGDDDSTKSGVGAQRLGGLHHGYVADKQNTSPVVEDNKRLSAAEKVSEKETRSWSNSTTSSFLSQHFPTRYFILKAKNEQDLQISVETGLWTTQLHNNPVLDQAYRTSKDGVFLIFGANRGGEWFGYARMSGPIFSTRRLSSNRETTPLLKSTIPEGEEAIFPHILPDSESSRIFDSSPALITPSGIKKPTTPVASPLAKKVIASASAPPTFLENLHIPDDAFVARRADTMDPKHLVKVEPNGPPSGELMEKSASIDIAAWDSASQSGFDSSPKPGSISPSERNAILEKREEIESPSTEVGEKLPFRVDWIKTTRVPFTRVRHIRNSFNENREVKVSRDGTEIEPVAGQELISHFWQDSTLSDPSSSDHSSPRITTVRIPRTNFSPRRS